MQKKTSKTQYMMRVVGGWNRSREPSNAMNRNECAGWHSQILPCLV